MPLDKHYSKLGRCSTYDYGSLLKVDILTGMKSLTLENWPEFSHYDLIEVDRFACYSSACLCSLSVIFCYIMNFVTA